MLHAALFKFLAVTVSSCLFVAVVAGFAIAFVAAIAFAFALECETAAVFAAAFVVVAVRKSTS